MSRHAVLAAAVVIGLIATAPATAQDAVSRGEYLVRAAGCIACHTDKKSDGALFAGGRALHTPFGTFYSSNITPDPDTGIGNWTDADFIAALREGRSPEGHLLYPVFPYSSYTKMRDEDILAIKAYLFAQPPVRQKNKDQEPNFPLGWRFLLNGWKVLNFDTGPVADDPNQSDAWNRGRYLVDALAHCGECHTPRTLTGGLDQDMYLAGTADGPDGEKVPNITPAESGIADWSETDIAYLLKEGLKPNYDNVQGSMAEAIDDGLTYLTDEDLDAIATYLKSIPPIEHKVGN